jgi:DNA-binding Xre family transcriptional regulator
MNEQKERMATEIRSIMGAKMVDTKDLAKSLSVTPQTIRNMKHGNASIHLMEYALKTLDTWSN